MLLEHFGTGSWWGSLWLQGQAGLLARLRSDPSAPVAMCLLKNCSALQKYIVCCRWKWQHKHSYLSCKKTSICQEFSVKFLDMYVCRGVCVYIFILCICTCMLVYTQIYLPLVSFKCSLFQHLFSIQIAILKIVDLLSLSFIYKHQCRDQGLVPTLQVQLVTPEASSSIPH